MFLKGLIESSMSPRELERLKWFLWHGNVLRALQTVEDLAEDLWPEHPEPERARLLRALREFEATSGPTPGRSPTTQSATWPASPFSTAFVESTVNQLVSKRIGQAARHALDAAWHPPHPSGLHPCAQRRHRRRLPPLVPVVRAHSRQPEAGRIGSQVSPVSGSWARFSPY